MKIYPIYLIIVIVYYLCVPVYVSGSLEPFACFWVTDNKDDWPDRVRLAQRYEMFKNAG